MKKAPATEVTERPTRRQYISAPTHQNTRGRRNRSISDGYAERLEAICATLRGAGIEPANPDTLLSQIADADGRPVRFPTASKPGRKNGWLVAYQDQGLPCVVIAGDWGTGAEAKWVARTVEDLDPGAQRERQNRLHQARRAREAAQRQQWERTAERAARIWHASAAADPQHPYLLSKGIHAHRARQRGRNLQLLLTDFTGKAWSLQTIDATGNKRLMAGGQKNGHFIVVDGPSYPARVLICEGFATGCTLAELDPTALVLAAVDCSNLKTVATGARNRWPNADLIVCGDDDRLTVGNPGATAARAAALAARATLALPEWPPNAPLELSDFNDLQNWLRGRK